MGLITITSTNQMRIQTLENRKKLARKKYIIISL
jgi:hypothetical protein